MLDSARSEPQVIVDTDDEQLVIQLKSDADFDRELGERIRQLARFQAIYADNRDRAVSEWAQQTEFPYLAPFDVDEVESFARELLAYTLDAGQRHTLENLDGNLRAWASSAGIYESPELLERMTACVEMSQVSEVSPPSEEQAQAAEA